MNDAAGLEVGEEGKTINSILVKDPPPLPSIFNNKPTATNIRHQQSSTSAPRYITVFNEQRTWNPTSHLGNNCFMMFTLG